jgi:hypothetical protein
VHMLLLAVFIELLNLRLPAAVWVKFGSDVVELIQSFGWRRRAGGIPLCSRKVSSSNKPVRCPCAYLHSQDRCQRPPRHSVRMAVVKHDVSVLKCALNYVSTRIYIFESFTVTYLCQRDWMVPLLLTGIQM